MLIRIHNSYRDVVSIVDKELLGKKFEEGNFQLDIKESFYKGEEYDEENALKIMINMALEDSTFNIVGEKSIKTSLKAGIITKDSIKRIQNIPYSLVLV